MTDPERRPLGGTGMTISPVGLGTWAMGGAGWLHGWGRQDDLDSVATVHAAVGAGVNWIDTAPAYGIGHAEEVVGAAIATLPRDARPLLFTKCGLVPDDASQRYRPARRLARPESIRRELEESLRRLGVDHLDLYQVHQPGDGRLDLWGQQDPDPSPPATALEEYWQTLADLRAEGKIRAIGLSNHRVPELERAERVAHVDVIQPTLSVIARQDAPEIAWAAKRRVGVIAYQSMYSGLLSGAFTAERVAGLPADDWRRGDAEFTERLPHNLAVVARLRAVAAAHRVPVPAVAIAWVLRWPGVTGAIVGGRRPDQVRAWLAAVDLHLTPADLRRIDEVETEQGTGVDTCVV